MSFYRFPAISGIEKITNKQQIEKIRSEYIEVARAEIRYRCEKENDKRVDYGMELMDIIHAAETALRIEFTEDEVAELRKMVEEKNRARDYYDE